MTGNFRDEKISTKDEGGAGNKISWWWFWFVTFVVVCSWAVIGWMAILFFRGML